MNKSNLKAEQCLIIEKSFPSEGYCCLVVEALHLAGSALPGQFAVLYLPEEHRNRLPRPLSIFKVDKKEGRVTFFFQVKGFGTALFAAASPGDRLKLLGPLGRGFPPLQPGALLVGGGIGIAPLAFLTFSAKEPCTLVYAARSASHLVCPFPDFASSPVKLIEATDDGSRGVKGNAVQVSLPIIAKSSAVYACGPRPMLAALSRACSEAGVKAWVSLEEQIGCGIGACVCCAVKTASGYKRVCHDGPVFSASEVIFDD